MTVPQVRVLLTVTLPARRWDAATILALVTEIQRRNYAAACAHRQRRLHQLYDTS